MPALLTFPAAPPPEFPEGIDANYKTEETQFGDGYRLVAEDGINSRTDTVDLRWQNITLAEMVILRDFLEAHAPAKPFRYTPIDNRTRTFICRKWSARRSAVGFYEFSANLEQYYGA